MTTVLVPVAMGAGCAVVAGWTFAGIGGGCRSMRRRWAAGAAATSALLAVLSGCWGVLGAEALYAVVGVSAAWDWWRTRPPRPRSRAFLRPA